MGRVALDSVAGWAAACSSAFVPLRVRSAAPRFAASLSQTALAPGIAITRVSSGASDVVRDRAMIATHPRDDLLLSLHRAGGGTVAQDARVARLSPGAAVLYDAATPYTLSFTGRIDEVVLQVPRAAIPRVGNAFADLTARTLPDTAAVRALTSLAVAVDGDRLGAAGAEAAAVADALLGLLASALLVARSEAPPVATALLGVALRSYADEHADDPVLDPATLARAHSVSLRLVHMTFAADGDSPAAYIRRRRLTRARHRLERGETVGTAAYSSGFRDADSFARAFRREYGIPPSAVRAGTAGETAAASAGPPQH